MPLITGGEAVAGRQRDAVNNAYRSLSHANEELEVTVQHVECYCDHCQKEARESLQKAKISVEEALSELSNMG
jgi:hypothetical protein